MTVGSMLNFSKQALQTYSSFEQIESGLQGVLKSSEKGTEMFERLRKFSFDTTFGVDTLSAAATQLLNVGDAEENIEEHLLQIGNIAQGDTNKFNELVSIYAKIQSTGKASSMQLQQLALRGVPIYQYLQKIGVQGTATGEQISQAFELMTSEGEQFYGTMERINDTIQGKEGFISDTFREMQTSLMESTGFADLYKASLDAIYDVLQNFVDFLAIVNSNPVYQALFRGTILTVVSALTITIGVGLVASLKKVVAQMTIIAALKSAINPSALIAGLAVGGTIGIVSAIATAMPKATESVNETTEAVKKLKEELTQGGYDSKDSVVKDYLSNLTELQDLIDEAIKKQDVYEKKVASLNQETNKNEGSIKRANAQLERQTGIVNELTTRYDKLKKALDAYKRSNEKEFNTDSMLNDFANIDSKSIESSIEEQITSAKKIIEEYKKKLSTQVFDNSIETKWEEVTNGGGVIKHESKGVYRDLTSDEKSQYEKGINQQYAIIAELNEKKSKEYREKIEKDINSKAWKEMLYKAFNFNINDVINGALLGENLDGTGGTEKAISTYLSKIQGNQDRYKEAQNEYGLDLFPDNTVENTQQLADLFTNLANQAILLKQTNSEAFDYSIGERGLNAIIEKAETYRQIASNNNAGEMFKQLDKELSMLKMTTLQRREQELIESGINENQAKGIALKEEQLELQKQYNQALKDGNVVSTMSKYAKDNAIESYQSDGYSAENIGEYIAGSIGENLSDLFSGSDIGNFISGFEQFGVIGGLMEMFGSALMDVIGGMDGMDLILNPIKNMLEELKPLIKTFMVLFAAVANWLVKVAEALMDWLDEITGGWFTEMAEKYDELVEAQDDEIERLQALNDQYEALAEAIDEQEQYYLKQRSQLSANNAYEALSSTNVNDMILTPQGVFNTSPEDTILAMKHPEDLVSSGRGSVSISVVINNTASDTVSASVSQSEDADGLTSMIVTISKKVATDAATGANGWDNAFNYRQQRLSGRSIS